MQPNVEFRVDLSKTNPGLAKSHLQRHVATSKKPPSTSVQETSEEVLYFKTRQIFRQIVSIKV